MWVNPLLQALIDAAQSEQTSRTIRIVCTILVSLLYLIGLACLFLLVFVIEGQGLFIRGFFLVMGIIVLADYLKFLKAILMSSVAKLPVDGFPFLMNSEASWSVFSKILSKRGLSFMDPSSIRELFPIFRALDYKKTTQTQFDVLKAVIMEYAVEEKNIRTGWYSGVYSKTITVINPFVTGLDILLSIVTEADLEAVSDLALQFIMKLFCF